MSTKLEDLPDSEMEYEEVESVAEEKQKQKQEQKPIEKYQALQIVFDGVRRPMIVSFLMMVLGHPFLASGIEKIPNIEYLTDRISIHFLLSIITGILFFFLDKLNQ